MSEPFIGEIRPFSFGYAPGGWATCDGQLLPINQNQALFALLGTMYGGNGQTNFALPDLRGRAAMHVAAAHPQGQSAGAEAVALTTAQVPVHNHAAMASAAPGTQPSPAGKFWAQDSSGNVIFSSAGNVPLAAGAIAPEGAGQPHANMQPYLTVSYCIALQGIFPSRD